jgi:Protein of unknown function DUF2625
VARQLSELIDDQEPAWPLVQAWMTEATNDVVVLPVQRTDGEETLLALQVTSRSPIGAIALETGGLIVDRGWLRILGSGHELLTGLSRWNGLGGLNAPGPPLADALVVGHDAIGGFFALNGGAFGHESLGNVFYFAPDSLQWEDLGQGYSAFLRWFLSGDLPAFYAGSRWPTWEPEVATATGDQGFAVYPFLSMDGPPIADRSRRLVPMTELWATIWQLSDQLGDLPPGVEVRFEASD